jgi:hypothetical protein
VRDHPNHERPLNGGMWGARKGFLDGAAERRAAMLQAQQARWSSSAAETDFAGSNFGSSYGRDSWARRRLAGHDDFWGGAVGGPNGGGGGGSGEVSRGGAVGSASGAGESLAPEAADEAVTMASLVRGHFNKDAYGADLTFLSEVVWPLVEHDHMAHDAYSCDRFPNAIGFPSPRPLAFQHVGQVAPLPTNRPLI